MQTQKDRAETQNPFWLSPERHPKTAIMAAWCSHIVDVQRWATLRLQSRTFPSPSEGAALLDDALLKGPVFYDFRERPLVSESWLEKCEKANVVDREIVRLVHKTKVARDLFEEAARPFARYGSLPQTSQAIMRAVDGLMGSPDKDAQPTRVRDYSWADECGSAADVILNIWHQNVRDALNMGAIAFKETVRKTVEAGPRVPERMARPVSALTGGKSLSEHIREIELIFFEVAARIGSNPTAFGLQTAQERMFKLVSENKYLRGCVGLETPAPHEEPGSASHRP
jgi:hypothetical protein